MHIGKRGRPKVCPPVLGAWVTTMLAVAAPAPGDEPSVVRVEEDWEVVLNEPASHLDAPQFHTVISPQGDLEHYHAQITWNYRERPDFSSGGMQIAALWNDQVLADRVAREDPLSTSAESISWTQEVRCSFGLLTFAVKNGSSSTWGSFGGAELTLTGAVGVYNLNGYSTDTSVENSWVSFGANRINLLRIKEVRRYDAAGNLLSRDSDPRVVFELNQ